MATSDTFSPGRLLRERPAAVLLAVVGLLLFGDLVMRLATGTVAVSTFARYVWNGLYLGLAYGLAGIGLSLTYSILNFANFAHGDYISAGAFSGWAAAFVVAGLGAADIADLLLILATPSVVGATVLSAPLAVILGLIAAVVGAVVLALLLDRIVYKPMRDQSGIALLIASIGVAFALRYLLAFLFTTEVRGVTGNVAILQVGDFLPVVGGFRVTAHQVTVVVVCLVLMLGLHLLLQFSKLGKAMRAMADNEDLARITGIPTERVVRYTWTIGAGLAGAAGFLIVLERGTIAFDFGWVLLLFIFAAVILGGIGSIYGAIVGGLIIGLADSVSLVWLQGPWSDFTQPVAFGMLILVLLFRPEGIFGGVETA